MIRVLVMVAVAGFLVSVASLTAAVGIAGPAAILNGGWSWNFDGWGGRWRSHDHVGWSDAGPRKTRQLAWSGGDTLDVEVPAEVRFTQAPGPARLTVSGPTGAVDDLEVDGGHIRYAHDRDGDADLTIVMSAPAVTRFDMQGAGRLTIAGYRQDSLDIGIEGDADVDAAGQANSVALRVSGSGDADLGAVSSKTAKVDISGSGAARLAPTDAAAVSISGSGDVTLLTHPKQLQTDISGSGRIRQDGGPAPSGSSET